MRRHTILPYKRAMLLMHAARFEFVRCPRSARWKLRDRTALLQPLSCKHTVVVVLGSAGACAGRLSGTRAGGGMHAAPSQKAIASCGASAPVSVCSRAQAASAASNCGASACVALGGLNRHLPLEQA